MLKVFQFYHKLRLGYYSYMHKKTSCHVFCVNKDEIESEIELFISTPGLQVISNSVTPLPTNAMNGYQSRFLVTIIYKF